MCDIGFGLEVGGLSSHNGDPQVRLWQEGQVNVDVLT